jgi:hypothetical protein
LENCIIKAEGVCVESNYYIKVKTGFFKTTKYQFVVKNSLVDLIPVNSNDRKISIKEDEILSVLLIKKEELYVNFDLKEGE